MPRKHLTAAFINNVKAPADRPQIDYFDTVLPAFGLRVGSKSKTFFVLVRVLKGGDWKLTRVKLGTAGELELADARKEARAAMERAEKGEAPAEVRKERREQQKADSKNTFASVLNDFLKKYRTRSNRKPAPRTLAEIKRALSSDLFEEWTDRPLAKITRRDVLDVQDGLIERGYESAANRYLVYLKMLFGWALDRGIIDGDPTARVKKQGAERSRERVLRLDEMRAVWKATEPTQENKGDLFAGIVKVLMLTGQRRTEVGGMRWSEVNIDRGLWSLPPERTKNNLAHLVPLTAPIVEILKERQAEQKAMEMKTPFVFTSTGKASFSGWSKSKARLDGRATIEPWTLHDLRRTLVTRMSEDLRIPPQVVEAVVNHISGVKAGVAGTYNRALYLDERRKALDAWSAYVLRVVGEAEPSNVVELVR